MHKGVAIFTVIFSFLLLGCATTYQNLDTIRLTHSERIKSKTFEASLLTIFDITKKVCKDLSLEIRNVELQEKLIKIYVSTKEKGIGRIGVLERIGIYLTEIEAKKTKIEILAENRYFWSRSANDYRQALKSSILNLIEIELRG